MEAATETPPATADAAEARREARRRRILENSSQRLAKITGRPEAEIDAQLKSEQAVADVEPAIIYEDPPLEAQHYEPPQRLHPDHLPNAARQMGAIDSEMERMLAAMAGNMAGGGMDANGQHPFAMFQGLGDASALDAPTLLNMASLFGGAPADGTPTADGQPASPLVRVLRTKLHVAALGVLTYVLACNDLMFRSHVFTLFLLWEAVELFAIRPYETDGLDSAIGVMVLFVNVNGQRLKTLSRWFVTLRRVLKDVAIFMFAFVLLHQLFGSAGGDLRAAAGAFVERAADVSRILADTDEDGAFEF